MKKYNKTVYIVWHEAAAPNEEAYYLAFDDLEEAIKDASENDSMVGSYNLVSVDKPKITYMLLTP